ncbi:MAG: AlpA family phage regulatory protein [Sutterella sp.]|nr:AlpA family phage regulatory protein [Sutterella sp.]
MNNKQFIRVHTLAEMLSVSRSTIWRWVHEKKNFPRPIQLSKGITVWSVEEVQSWVAQNRK